MTEENPIVYALHTVSTHSSADGHPVVTTLSYCLPTLVCWHPCDTLAIHPDHTVDLVLMSLSTHMISTATRPVYILTTSV